MRYSIILTFLLINFRAHGQNLIINPGAEVPPLTLGWTQVSGFWTNGIEVAPRTGTYHFYAGDNSTNGSEIYQDINVSAMATSIDAGASTFTFSSWLRVFNFSGGWNDQSRVYVEYRDVSSAVLSTYDSGYRSSLSWTNYSDVRIAPVGTRTIRIRLVASRLIGTAADGYFDDLVLTHSSTLPVNLISFDAQQTNTGITLLWQTASEINNDYFILEKSMDAKNWFVIDTTRGKEKSESLLLYEFWDGNPTNGVQYYRLSQKDINGTVSVFSIIAENFSAVSPLNISVYPNPIVGGIFNCTSILPIDKIEIYSLFGKMIYQTKVDAMEAIIEFPFNAGYYNLMIYAGGELFVEKILIQ